MTRPIGNTLGKILLWRTRGREYLELFRAWVVPVSGVAGVSKYLGLQSRWALVAGIALPVLIEVASMFFGWLDVRSGAGRAHQAQLNTLDPYKDETLRLFRQIAEDLERISTPVITMQPVSMTQEEWDERLAAMKRGEVPQTDGRD
ncbi:MAG: hypothetical protein A2W26_11895 [Acidobacteria bacterium RBG_16_64_8]|nr:MAG: hypothetical protein A2W26_11895 [Acidobacteria bacterium RBG_16_64_8]